MEKQNLGGVLGGRDVAGRGGFAFLVFFFSFGLTIVVFFGGGCFFSRFLKEVLVNIPK